MENRKHLFIAGLIIFALFYSAALITFGIHLSSAKTQVEQAAPNPRYTVKEYNGKIAVFEFDSATPTQILNINVSTLRQYDRLRFLEGITLNSNIELYRLIEDFGS